MATNSARLADLTMADLERCYRILCNLDEADTAVQSANMPGKAAVRHLLRQCYDEALAIMRKGAAPAIRKAAGGMWSRQNQSREFWDRIISLAPRRADTPSEGEQGGSDNG